MHLSALTATALVATASATKLYVSSYAGTITTLNLTHAPNGTYYLGQLESSNGCQPNASWIHLDAKHNNLYCVDEGIAVGNGTLNSFKLNPDTGVLSLVNRTTTLNAPVNSAIYTSPNGSQLLAVAHYAWGLTTWKLDPQTGAFAASQVFNFTLEKPGPNAARQAAPHPHQVLVDPSNRYLVIPDLGADLLRIFYVDPATLLVSARPTIPVVPGSGPRHGAFHVAASHKQGAEDQTYYYLVTELANTLTGYKVTYLGQNGGLSMTPFTNSTTYGPANATAFAGNAAAEIEIAKNGKSLLVSNRNATFFDIKNPDPKNATRVASDTMAEFDISGDGTAHFGQLTPAGGSFPRSFAENPKGNLVAIGLQNSGRVVIYERCKVTGRLGKDVVADFEGLGQVTNVVWGK